MLRRIHSILSNPQFRREVAKAGLAPSLERGAFEAEPPMPGFAGGKAFSEVTPALGASLDGGIQVPPREEAIILLEERPALLVRKGRFEMPRSGVWVEVLGAHRNLIEPRLQSVGRIELDEGEGFHHIGTGWVIAEKMIATNRHVAEIFAAKQGEGGKFLTSFQGVPFQARIDFREEYQEQAAFEVAVEEVVFMEGVDRKLPDIAFLRLASHDGLPEPIPLLETPAAPGAPTVVIGYPAFDPRYGLDAIVAAAQVFGTIYDVKRLSPGYIMGWDDGSWFFTHDATTLGGNSGSAVLDVGTGYVVGMHFKGDFRHENYAVKASKLLEYAVKHKVSVLGRRSLPQTTPVEVPDAAAEEAPPESYDDRQGYQENFIGEGFAVPLPKLSGTNTAKVLTFRDPVTGETATVLAYTHYAVVR